MAVVSTVTGKEADITQPMQGKVGRVGGVLLRGDRWEGWGGSTDRAHRCLEMKGARAEPPGWAHAVRGAVVLLQRRGTEGSLRVSKGVETKRSKILSLSMGCMQTPSPAPLLHSRFLIRIPLASGALPSLASTLPFCSCCLQPPALDLEPLPLRFY